MQSIVCTTLAGPGFPVGGVDLVEGGPGLSRRLHFKILYVKTIESGPLGEGACAGHAP